MIKYIDIKRVKIDVLKFTALNENRGDLEIIMENGERINCKTSLSDYNELISEIDDKEVNFINLQIDEDEI